MGVQDREWYWDRDRSKPKAFRGYGPFRRRGRYGPGSQLLAAIGGAAVVWIAGTLFVQWRAQVAAEQIMRVGQDALQRAQAQAQQQQREAVERQAKNEAKEAQRLQVLAEQQRGAAEARLAAQQAEERKAKAWARFFRPSPACADAATTECANEFIRAKRSFEEKYARGAL